MKTLLQILAILLCGGSLWIGSAGEGPRQSRRLRNSRSQPLRRPRPPRRRRQIISHHRRQHRQRSRPRRTRKNRRRRPVESLDLLDRRFHHAEIRRQIPRRMRHQRRRPSLLPIRRPQSTSRTIHAFQRHLLLQRPSAAPAYSTVPIAISNSKALQKPPTSTADGSTPPATTANTSPISPSPPTSTHSKSP